VCVVNSVCCQVEVCVWGLSLVRRSPTECGVSAYDHETSIMKRHWLTGAFALWFKKKTQRLEEAAISVDVSTRFKLYSLCRFQKNIVNNVFTESAHSTLNVENERPCLAQAFSRPPLK